MDAIEKVFTHFFPVYFNLIERKSMAVKWIQSVRGVLESVHYTFKLEKSYLSAEFLHINNSCVDVKMAFVCTPYKL